MVAEVCQSAEEHIIVSYSRKEFLQTGAWVVHFPACLFVGGRVFGRAWRAGGRAVA